MKIIDGYRGVAPEARGAVAAIGNFDGVHKGHQVLLDDARRVRNGEQPLAVISFEPHPRQFFQPDSTPFRLTTAQEKARILDRLGVDLMYQIGFDARTAGMAATSFVRDVLVDGLGISHLVVGADFHFGKGRAGSPGLLRQMGTELGFGVTVQELVGDDSGDYASTAIRKLVAAGQCAEAAKQLGRWHTVSGIVERGDQRGRDLGYPTANIPFGEQLVPCFGVYAAEVAIHDGPHAGTHRGVASIGERPTFGINAPNFEVHIFDFAGDIYGAEISVGLVSRLRGEEKFDSIEALVAQMNRDSDTAREALRQALAPR